MKSAYQNNAVDTVPDLTQLTSDGYPTNGNSSLGIPATQPGAAWFHSVTSEIVNAITALGGTPSNDEVNQLASALVNKFNGKANTSGTYANLTVGNATNATNCPNYLPLVGGTVTGSITSTTGSGGAALKSGNHQIYMIDTDSQSIGYFLIRSTHAGTSRDFILKADGSITWGGSNVECVSEKGNGYIRYSNGLQICWGTQSTDAGFAFPKPFNSRPSVTATSTNGERLVCVQTAVNTSGATIMQWTDGTPYWISGKSCDYIAVGTWK